MSKKKIVVIGGGNGSSTSINSLKCHLDVFDLTAVVSMSDSGGSTGRLRKEFDTLPPGDILRAVLAMSKYDYKILRQIFNKNRFSSSNNLNGHNLGNLFLVLVEKYCGDYLSAILALSQAVEAVGNVYPVTLDKTDLVVELDNGKIIKEEGIIDRPKESRKHRIVKAWLEPDGNISIQAREAITQADALVVGPGSLYTSIVATLLPGGVKDAIKKSTAKIIYVTGSIYEQEGEFGPERLSEFVDQLQGYLPRKIDHVLYSNHEPNKEELIKYKEKQWRQIINDKERLADYDIIVRDYEKPVGVFCHQTLGDLLTNIICK